MSVHQKPEIEKLHDTIETLKRENARLKKSVKQKNYGLVWMDVPEAFEKESENKIPILKEVKDKAIVNDDGKPTHILIEGENYHALTCLNYTHKEKIDVIYIDPPYNTGNDGFKYKDKRFLTKYPDGTDVPKESPFRHSYWLSFISKRLELAENLLKDTGVIFISIDDNEIGQLKLLCNKFFGEENVEVIIWQKTDARVDRNTNAKQINRTKDIHEYIIIAYKNKRGTKFNKIKKLPDWKKEAKNVDNDQRGAWESGIISFEEGHEKEDKSSEYFFTITTPSGRKITRHFFVTESEFNKLIKDNRIHFPKEGDGIPRLKTFQYEEKNYHLETIVRGFGTSSSAKDEIEQILGNREIFDTPKPLKLIQELIRATSKNNIHNIILDFFAGSGTALHATMALNAEDNGVRQCILVTNNENEIAENVCYERNKRVIKGYTKPNKEKVAGLGNSLKYYHAAFIGENDISKANDEDIVKLAHHAGELLALAENTLYEIERNDYYQIFKSEKRFTAIYFREEFNQFEKFVSKIEKLKKPVSIYVFSWGNQNEFEAEFEHIGNARVKSIPQPILEIYQSIYNLIPQQ